MDRRVVVLGSCSVCHVFASPNLPNRGETVIGDDYHLSLIHISEPTRRS